MSKRIFLTLIIAIVFKLSASAQKIDTIVYYLKSFRAVDWPSFNDVVPVNNKDSADFYRVILPPDTTTDRSLFIVNDFYKNGKPRMVGKTKDRDYRVNLNGACIRFFPNGRRKSVENYSNGKLKGSVVEYFPNGKIYLTGMYNDSSKLIIDESSDSIGKVLAQNGNGHYIKYDESFKQIQSEGDIMDGRENGEWHGILGDTIKYTCMYVKGVGKNGISHNTNGKEYIFAKAEDEPEFKGGITSFYKFLQHEIHYPAVAKQHNVQGKVFLTFVINKEGSLLDIKVVRGIGSGCDEESVRVLRQSPKWRPGKLYGVPVRVQYTMPISYTLAYENR